MEDLDFVLDVIEPWLAAYVDRGASALSPRETIGVGVWMLEAEVNNGGFQQYYGNSRGSLAEATVEALKAIGAIETASLLAAANKDIPCFPLPEDRDERFALLDEVAETARFGALETKFYQRRKDRIVLLASFLRTIEGKP